MKMIKEQIAIVEASRKVITMSDTEKQINYEARPHPGVASLSSRFTTLAGGVGAAAS